MLHSARLSRTSVWSFIVLPLEVSGLQAWKWSSMRRRCQFGINNVQRLSILTAENLKTLHKIKARIRRIRFTAIVSRSLTTHHISHTWLHLNFISSQNWRNIWEDIKSLSDDEVKTAVKMWFRQQGAQFCRDGLMKDARCWWKCVDRRGDYAEK
jgi:hypothetical protein